MAQLRANLERPRRSFPISRSLPSAVSKAARWQVPALHPAGSPLSALSAAGVTSQRARGLASRYLVTPTDNAATTIRPMEKRNLP